MLACGLVLSLWLFIMRIACRVAYGVIGAVCRLLAVALIVFVYFLIVLVRNLDDFVFGFV